MKTATEAQVLMDVAKADYARMMKENDDLMQQSFYNALAKGTSVFYSTVEVFEGPLVICPSAGCYESCAMCSCSMVHIRGECGVESVRNPMPGCDCPAECQVIDQEVVEDIDFNDRVDLFNESLDRWWKT